MKRILPLSLIMMLTACGGGGGSEDKSLNFSDFNFPSQIKENQKIVQNLTINNSSNLTKVTAVGLPDWLTFNSSTLSVEGTPDHSDAGEQYTFSFEASDKNEVVRSEVISIKVNHPTLELSRAIEEYVFEELTNIRFNLDVQSDLAFLEYRLINAPDWLSINESTGELSGIAAHEDADKVYENIQVQVSDGVHETKSNVFSIKIEGVPLAFSNQNALSLNAIEDIEFTYLPRLEHNLTSVIFSAKNLPNWLVIDPATGEISGTPINEIHIDTFENIEIIVSDKIRTATLSNISITVTEVNDKPVIASSQIILDELQQDYKIDIDVFDEETPFEQLRLVVFEQSTNFDVVVDAKNDVYLTLVNPVNALTEGIRFDLEVFDGVNTIRAKMNVVVSATDPLHVRSSHSGDVYTADKIELNFDQFVNVSDIKYQQSDGVCQGDIQVSNNEFQTCLGLNVDQEKSNASQFLFELINTGINVNYQIKVLNTLHSLVNTRLEQETVFDFYTLSSLMITEIGGRAYYNSQHWFEVYNASKNPVDLNDYELNTRAINESSCGRSRCNIVAEYTFPLDPLVIQPGQYAIVRGQDWKTKFSDADRVIYIEDNGHYPYWDNRGYIELVKKSDNATADFVVFGNWRNRDEVPTPVTASAWSGGPQSSSPQSSFQETAYTESLTRYSNLQDNNNPHDWVARPINTPGGPNDVTSRVDSDQDGIPDEAEVEGSTYAGLSLYDMGARVNQKDIFIEVDYMNSSDEGVIPREEALQKVVDAFSEKNIAIHFDAGNLYDQAEGINPARFDLGGGNQVPFSPGVSLGVQPGDTRASAYEIKHSNMDLARLSIFHYMLMANSQKADGSNGSSGLAELNGNDFIITLGNWNLHSRNERAKNVLINFQAGTIMHELGHNLGLRHGGGDDVNNKPNYVSIMNYMYQLEGLPEIGNNEGDRYYRFRNRATGQSNCNTDMTNPSTSDFLSFKIDYSNEVTSLNEALISESIGLKQTGSASVDFNCDGLIGTQRNLDVNDSNSIEVLTGHDDWSSLNLRFQSGYSANFNGSKLLENDDVQDSFKLHPDHVGNDIGIVVPEYAPSQEFMDSIKY